MLKVQTGDLWSRHRMGFWVVVTTNIGWDPETKRNNMGAGMALQSALRWGELPEWYGRQCEERRDSMPVVMHQTRRLIFFPVKPLLDDSDPERSWDQVACLATIERSARQLAALKLDPNGPIAMALPGCGNGGLPPFDVLPILNRHLDGRVAIVDRAHAPLPTASPNSRPL